MGVELLRIEQIKTGDRARRDQGDLSSLADSITEVGLLHPIVVTPDLDLVAGGRRLAACRRLGWDEVPVRVVTSLTTASSLLRAERDENTCRKDLVPSEVYALGRQLEALEAPKATERQSEAGRLHGRGQIAPSDSDEAIEPARTDERVAQAVGTGKNRYRQIKEVHEAAEDESKPEPIRKAAAELAKRMDLPKGNPKHVAPSAAARAIKDAETHEQIDSAASVLDPDADLALQRARLAATVSRLAKQHGEGLLQLDPEGVSAVLGDDSWFSMGLLAERSAKWFDALMAQRSRGLRVVGGND